MKHTVYKYCVLIFIGLFAASCGGDKPKGNDNALLRSTPALKEITEKIENSPKEASLYFQRGNLLHQLEEDSLAYNDFVQASTLDSNRAEYFSAVGDLLFEHKDISGSVKWLEKAMKLNPNDKKAQLKLAKMFVYIKEYTSAFRAINDVLRQDAYNPEAYFLKGMIYKDMKDTAKSISSFETAVSADPNYVDAVVQLGQLYSMKKDPIALKYYDKAWHIDTTDVFPLYAKGVFYQHQNDYAAAKMAYHEALLHDRNYVDAYFNVADMLMQQDSTDKAMRQYNILAQIDQADPDVYYYRAKCFEKLGKKEDAINDYQQALVFDEKYIPAKEALQRLQKK
ncbi:MAG: tetratricopeptide repeat protein [Bacteroidetes bacterium]|nr:tetratricopeptide repeat protein [Bacteroidota bacterium]